MSDDRGADRRSVFDRAADEYHDARPGYPEAITDRLMELLSPEPTVLEVGPGTGQATEVMLQGGASVRAVELGPRLAVQLAQRLADYLETGRLEVFVADFETLEPQAGSMDGVVSATAYHWVAPSEQLTRPPRWLKADGRLAVIDTIQVGSESDGGYFAAAQPIYERYGQATGQPKYRPHDATPAIYHRMQGSDQCVDLTLDHCPWDQTYDTASYRALLNTYSGTLAMPEPERTDMVDELIELVTDMGGEVTRPLVITLATCRFVD